MIGLSFGTVEGSSFAGNVAEFVDPGCSATYSATISWGDGQMSSGAITYNGTCAAGYNVVSSHTYAEEGTYRTSVSVSGTDGFSGTGTGTATVSDAAISLSPLTVTFTAAKRFDENVAVLRDADPAGIASDYGSTINWGDGQTSAGVVSAATEGAFDIAGHHTYSTAGLHTVHVTARDSGGAVGEGHDERGIPRGPWSLHQPATRRDLCGQRRDVRRSAVFGWGFLSLDRLG